MPIRVTLLYFGQAREGAGLGEESFSLPSGSSVRALVREATGRHPRLSRLEDVVKIAVNEEFAAQDETLKEGDVVALLPPVAGG